LSGQASDGGGGGGGSGRIRINAASSPSLSGVAVTPSTTTAMCTTGDLVQLPVPNNN
jgi:hypothetical protein